MKYNLDDIGGKEVGPVNITFVEDVRRAREYEGYALSLLGAMKNEMGLGGVVALSKNVIMPPRQEGNTLMHYMVTGDLVGNVPLGVASTTLVLANINSMITLNSIRGKGAMADQDSIIIKVSTSYDIKLKAAPKVIGFTVHFRDAENWGQNVIYIVAEPYKTSSLSVGVTARNRDDLSYADLEAWREDILHGGLASSQMFSPYWYKTFGWEYVPVTGDPIYDQAAPILGDEYPGDGSDITKLETIQSIYQDPAFSLLQTKYGLYAISKPDFNHVDSGKYDFEHGFVGKVECLLKQKEKETKETAEIYSVPFVNDAAGGFDPVELTGNNLLVNNPQEFLDGWYGIGMVTWDQGSGRDSNIGGFTFIWHMDDGSKRSKKFHDIELHSGNYAFPDPRAAPINSGNAFALFNPKLGLLNLYEGVSDSDNPFYDANASYQNHFYPALRKGLDKELKPTRSFNVFEEGEGNSADVSKPPTL